MRRRIEIYLAPPLRAAPQLFKSKTMATSSSADSRGHGYYDDGDDEPEFFIPKHGSNDVETSSKQKRRTLSCADEAKSLKSCLKSTECYKTDRKSMAECAATTEECSDVVYAYFACKRGLFDARSRLRGVKGKRDR